MDKKESNAYFETAEEQERDAELAYHEARYALTAFLSASAAENALSALLVTLGAKPSRKHRNSLVLHRILASQPKPTRKSLEEIIENMKTLEPHITRARYPIRKGILLVPPSDFYNKQLAKQTLDKAKRVNGIVRQILSQSREQD